MNKEKNIIPLQHNMLSSLLGEADETDSEKGVRRTIILSHLESVRTLD